MEHTECRCCLQPSSAQQTLSELDFQRGLWQAALDGDLDSVVRLIRVSGRDVNQTDSSGYTPLHYACRSGHLKVAEYLLDRGACPNARTKSGHVTPLHRAAYSGHENVVRLLISRGAKLDLMDTDGRNALHKAAEKAHVAIVEMLMEKDPGLQNVRDNRGKCPVDYLAGQGDQKMASLLKPD